MNKIKWGILGCGGIANSFAADLRYSQCGQLAAVASRSKRKANAFAQKHNAPTAYGSYEQLVKDADIDVVYVATPHPFHKARIRIGTPLDFLVVSDHGEYMGVVPKILQGDPLVANTERGRLLNKLAAEGKEMEAFGILIGHAAEHRLYPGRDVPNHQDNA